LQNVEGETDSHHLVNENGKEGKNGCHDYDSSLTTVSSPEPEEYTYERAIQGYVNFAETRVKSRTAVTSSNVNSSREQLEKSHTSESSTEKISNGHCGKGLSSPPHTPRRQSGAKIEEKLSALEKRRCSSTELNNSINKDKKMPMAKGDVLKRREMFERACEFNEQISKPARRVSEDSQGRLLHHANKAEEATPPIKEKVLLKSSENINGKDSSQLRHRFSNGDISSTLPVQDRLSQLEKRAVEKDKVSDDLTQSIKERLSNLDSAYNKNDNRNITSNRDPNFQTALANFHGTEEKVLNGVDGIKGPGVGSVRSSSPEDDVIYETKRSIIRQFGC
jgi:F-box protein 20